MENNQRAAYWALFLTILIIIYLTFYPFSFEPVPAAVDWRLPWTPNFDFSLSDLIGNILFFIPLGFFSGLVFRHFITGLGLAGLLSAMIESVQRFIPGRQASLLDFLANVGGAILGLILARLWPQRSFSFKSQHLFLFNASFWLYEPFFFSLDPGEVFHHLRQLTLSFGPQNLFLAPVFLALWGFWRRLTWTRFILLALVLEGGRLFMLTASLSPAKGLLRVILSALVLWFLKNYPQRMAQPLALAYLLEAAAPFRFHPLPQSPSLYPFASSLDHFYPQGLFALLETFLFFATWPLVQRKSVFLSALSLALLGEGIQLFLPERHPDLTTILVAGLATAFSVKFLGGKSDL